MKLDLNKIIELFNKLNDQARYGIFGGVVFLIIVLDIFLLGLPQWSGIVDVNKQITKLTQDTEQVLIDKQRIGQLKKSLDEARLQFNALNDKVRPIQEVPIILGVISNAANEYGVKIDQLAPDKVHQAVIKKSNDGNYCSLPIMVKARCGYHMFGKFLNRLEAENMYFIVSDFIIQNDDKDIHARLFSLTLKMILIDHSSNRTKSL